MSKAKPSKLDAHTERLTEWFTDKKTLAWVRDQLDADGLQVSLSRLSEWWQCRQAQLRREAVSSMVDDYSEFIEAKLKAYDPNADPGKIRQFAIDELIKKGRATEDDALTLDAARMQLAEVTAKTRAKIEQAKIEQGARRIHLLEQKAANALALIEQAKTGGGLTPETLEKIERELKLL